MGFSFPGTRRLQVENDLSLPDSFFFQDFELMMGGALDGSLYGMAAFIIGLPSNCGLKCLSIQGKKVEITKQEPLGFKKIDEFIEPVDQKFFHVMPFERDGSGFFGPNGFRIGDDVKEGLSSMTEKVGQGFTENPDTLVSGMIKEFELTHAAAVPGVKL
jgi:hypothetical protein